MLCNVALTQSASTAQRIRCGRILLLKHTDNLAVYEVVAV